MTPVVFTGDFFKKKKKNVRKRHHIHIPQVTVSYCQLLLLFYNLLWTSISKVIYRYNNGTNKATQNMLATILLVIAYI